MTGQDLFHTNQFFILILNLSVILIINMVYKLRYNYTLGGILMGLVCVYMGTMMLKSGYEFYGPYFQAYRKWLFPQLKNRLTPSWTWDDLGKLVF